MRDRDDDRLPNDLARATNLLRAEESVRPEWRSALLDEIARTPRDAAEPRAAVDQGAMRRRGIHLSVPMAIAAGIVCAIGGAAVSRVATRPAPTTVTSAATSQPAPTSSAALPVRFSVVAPTAASVSIVGDFNHWNPTALPMTRSADGKHWEIEVRLPLGRYSYAFLIDGKISPDPAAPQGSGDDFGAPNSVLMVRGSGT